MKTDTEKKREEGEKERCAVRKRARKMAARLL